MAKRTVTLRQPTAVPKAIAQAVAPAVQQNTAGLDPYYVNLLQHLAAAQSVMPHHGWLSATDADVLGDLVEVSVDTATFAPDGRRPARLSEAGQARLAAIPVAAPASAVIAQPAAPPWAAAQIAQPAAPPWAASSLPIAQPASQPAAVPAASFGAKPALAPVRIGVQAVPETQFGGRGRRAGPDGGIAHMFDGLAPPNGQNCDSMFFPAGDGELAEVRSQVSSAISAAHKLHSELMFDANGNALTEIATVQPRGGKPSYQEERHQRKPLRKFAARSWEHAGQKGIAVFRIL